MSARRSSDPRAGLAMKRPAGHPKATRHPRRRATSADRTSVRPQSNVTGRAFSARDWLASPGRGHQRGAGGRRTIESRDRACLATFQDGWMRSCRARFGALLRETTRSVGDVRDQALVRASFSRGERQVAINADLVTNDPAASSVDTTSVGPVSCGNCPVRRPRISLSSEPIDELVECA